MSASAHDPPGSLATLAVLIPAWQPEDRLLTLIDSLATAGFAALVLVDDGSGPAAQPLFEAVSKTPSVHLLRHAVNLGKGRALKTGINYVLTHLPHIEGLITADADGQHTPLDILRVAEAFRAAQTATATTTAATPATSVVLGARTFSPHIPLRSRFGNLLTRRIFAFVTGVSLTDTQTGLRAFPRTLLPELITLEGERYEYEMTVLVHLCRTRPKPIQLPIETVYIEANRSSHFDPIRDSMRIYFVLARYYFSSLVAASIDLLGFTLTFALTGNLLLSVAIGRLSSLINFALNKTMVFHNRGSVFGALWKYYVLVVAIGAISYGAIWSLSRHLHWNVYAAKITVDVLLSLISFSAQRTFVFRRTKSI